MKYCYQCGVAITDDAVFCPACGTRQGPVFGRRAPDSLSGGGPRFADKPMDFRLPGNRGPDFGEAIRLGLVKYVDFTGRASRAEYWWWKLFGVTVSFLASMFGATVDMLTHRRGAFIVAVWAAVFLAFLLPNFAMAVRRLHDVNRSGGWLLGGAVVAFAVMMVGAIVIVSVVEKSGQGADAVHAANAALGALVMLAYMAYGVLLLVWFCTRGTSGPNRYGPDPLA